LHFLRAASASRRFKGEDYEALEYVRKTIEARTKACLVARFEWTEEQAADAHVRPGGVFALIWNDPEVEARDQVRFACSLFEPAFDAG